jgi:hypothetical protein
MATVVADGTAERIALVRPYAPSWVNVLIAWIERLPGPAWAFFVALMAIGIVAFNGQAWLSGLTPVGAFTVALTYAAIFPVAVLWLIKYLDRVARDAFETYRPALVGSDAEAERWRFELTVSPARPALALSLLTVAGIVFGYITDPAAQVVSGLSPSTVALWFPLQTAAGVLIVMLLYQTLHQLRAVSRVHRVAGHVDLFQPAPLYAFSQLTSRTGIALVLMVSSWAFLFPERFAAPSTVVFAAGMGAVAVAAFVLPLEGMHVRIVGEKRRLQSEVGRRLTAAVGALHASVDGSDLSQADALNNTLSSLIAERELVAKLPTWPWQTGTLGGFVGAILLPIGLWLVTRLLEKVV